MKKLVVSALFISVFFIGISGLISGVAAKFQSDEKALELIRASRIALGGNQNLRTVKSMTIKAATTHFFEKNGVQDVKQGSMEINFEMPGKFSKKVMIGTPAESDVNAIVDKDVEVIVRGGDGPMSSDPDKKEVFVIRKGDGANVEWTSDENADLKGGKMRIKRGDGTVEELETGDKHKIFVRKEGDGHDNDENVWVTNDGQRMRVRKESGHGGESNEMLRITMGLLMTAPEDGSVSYKFLGQGSVDGFPSNIIGVESGGSMFKLFLDEGSNLPQMISYTGNGPHRIIVIKGDKVVQENNVGAERGETKGSNEIQIKFSDFRSVGGLLLPYRWTEMVSGNVKQNVDVTDFEINPADIAERLSEGSAHGGGQKVIIRKQKN